MGEIVSYPTASGHGLGHFVPAAGPGVLLLPDVQGLAPAIVAAAQRLAGAGVAALVVDLLRGQGGWGGPFEDTPSRLLARDPTGIAEDITGAARFLLARPLVAGDRVSVAGAGEGGAMALWAAAVCPTIGAVSAAYPAPSLRRLWAIRPPSLDDSDAVLHLAGDDREFGPAEAHRLGVTLRDQRRLVIHTYPGTRSGFLEDTRPDLYHATAAELVWQRVAAAAAAHAHRPESRDRAEAQTGRGADSRGARLMSTNRGSRTGDNWKG